MIKNATILRITAPNAATSGGSVTWTPAGSTLSGLRCCQSVPTRRQVFQFGALIKDATTALRVLKADLVRLGLVIKEGYQIQTHVDRAATTTTYRVVHTASSEHGAVSNVTAFLREVE